MTEDMIPFEGLFGNTAELRLIDFIWVMDDVEFSVLTLARECGVQERTMQRIVAKFLNWDILQCNSRTGNFSLNVNSKIIRQMFYLNEVIIDMLLRMDSDEKI